MRCRQTKVTCRSLIGGLLLVWQASLSTSAQDFLPPAPAWQGASEGLLVPPDDPWITPAEASGLTESPNYDRMIAWLKKLAEASPLIDAERVWSHGRRTQACCRRCQQGWR